MLTIPQGGGSGARSGPLRVTLATSLVTIAGAGAASTTIDGSGIDGVIAAEAYSNVAVQGMTLTAGALLLGGCVSVDHALFYLADSVVTGCTASSGGGAIFNEGTLIIARSDIRSSTADFGGGIDNSGMLTLIDSTVEHNVARRGGGLASAYGALVTVSGSTIASNTATDGGGVYLSGAATFVNSTITENAAYDNGGGISTYGNGASAGLFNVTIVRNRANEDGDPYGAGSGVYSDAYGAFFVSNSLIADNVDPTTRHSDDCVGFLSTVGQNRLGSTPYCGPYGCFPVGIEGCSITTIGGANAMLDDPALLGPLHGNGGPTATVALLPGSNAIDGGDPMQTCTDPNLVPLTVDQRGFVRPVGASCDIGAYEAGATNPVDAIFANGFD
ncbi:MAG TPA: right-handed parallel beta-helix repeat-containing protein [Dokdonella sp.]